jgi:hypothetical protein
MYNLGNKVGNEKKQKKTGHPRSPSQYNSVEVEIPQKRKQKVPDTTTQKAKRIFKSTPSTHSPVILFFSPTTSFKGRKEDAREILEDVS